METAPTAFAWNRRFTYIRHQVRASESTLIPGETKPSVKPLATNPAANVDEDPDFCPAHGSHLRLGDEIQDYGHKDCNEKYCWKRNRRNKWRRTRSCFILGL